MYDPNLTGTGHQPMYFDQMAALYNHYCIISSKIKVTFKQMTPAGNLMGAICGIFTDDDQTVTPTYLGDMAEQSDCKWAYTIAHEQLATVTNFYNPKKVFGGDLLANDQLQGTVTTNAPDNTNFVLWCRTDDSTSGMTVIYATVTIEYTATWTELRQIIGS